MESLPFSENKQKAILGHALADPEFQRTALSMVRAEWFVDPIAGKAYGALSRFVERFGRAPSEPEFMETQDFLREEPRIRTKLIGVVNAAKEQAQVYGVDALSDQLPRWHRARVFQSEITKAVDQYNREDVEGAFRTIMALPENATEPDRGIESAFRNFSVEELCSAPEKRVWIWEHKIPLAPMVGGFSGPGGSTKTTLALMLAVYRACGLTDFLGSPLRPGKTVFVTAEEDELGIRERVEVAAKELADRYSPEAVADNLGFVSLVGIPFRLVSLNGALWEPETAAVTELSRAIKRRAPGADLIIIETVSRLGSDESNPGHAALVAACEQVARTCNAAVLLIGHVSKEVSKSRSTDAHSGRGGSALSDNCRFNLAIARFPDEAARQKKVHGFEMPPEIAKDLWVLHANKVNGAPEQAPIVLRRFGTPWGAAMRPFDPEDVDAVETILKANEVRELAAARQVADAVIRLAAEGKTASLYSLDRKHRKALGITIPRAALEAAVERARQEGWITTGCRQGALAPAAIN
jgi:RecA-family ATPase